MALTPEQRAELDRAEAEFRKGTPGGNLVDGVVRSVVKSSPVAVSQSDLDKVGKGELPPVFQSKGPEEPFGPPRPSPETANSDNVVTASKDITGNLEGETAVTELLLGRRAPAVNPNTIRPAGYEYQHFGPNGKRLFEKGYIQDPQESLHNLREGVDAQFQKDQELAPLYKQEAERVAKSAAESRFQREQDMVALEARQKQLSQATEQYARDLHSEGSFWKNPGNVLSAIAYALMPITSSDPTIGVKMIDQAVARDLAERRADADSKLGALRSNIAGFREIMGSREAGDAAAEAAAKLVAIDQVKAVAAKFQGPIAKAQSQAVISSMSADAARLQATATQQSVYKPEGIVNKATWAAHPKGGESGFRPWTAQPDPQPLTGEVAQRIASTAPGQKIAFGSAVPATTAAKVNTTKNPDLILLEAIEGRIPGSANLAIAARRQLDLLADKHLPHGTQEQKDAYKEELVRKGKEDAKQAGPALIPVMESVAQFSAIQRLHTQIVNQEKAAGRDPDKWLNNGLARAALPNGVVDYGKNVFRALSGDPSNKEERTDKANDQAQRDYRQALNMTVVKFRNSISGGAISPSESVWLEKSVNPETMTMTELGNFIRQGSMLAESKRKAVIGSMGQVGGLYWMINNGTGHTNPVDTKTE